MHDDNPFSPNSMQRPPHTTSPAMSPASSHMSPVHCMSPGTGSHMSPVSMSPAGHMSPNHRQGSPQPNMVGMRPPIPAGQVMQIQGGRGFMRPVGPGFGNPMRPPTQQQQLQQQQLQQQQLQQQQQTPTPVSSGPKTVMCHSFNLLNKLNTKFNSSSSQPHISKCNILFKNQVNTP